MSENGAPRKVVLEENGKKRIVSTDDLRVAAQNGSIARNAKIWANGREYSWTEVKNALLGSDGASTGSGAGSGGASTGSGAGSGGASTGSGAGSGGASTNVPTMQPKTPRRGGAKTSAKKSKKALWIGGASALLLLLGVGFAVALFGGGKEKDGDAKETARAERNGGFASQDQKEEGKNGTDDASAEKSEVKNGGFGEKTKSDKTDGTVDAEGYSLLPFDAKTNRIPAGYQGHNVRALCDALGDLGKGLEKDEYETTADFQRRAAEFRRNLLQNKVLGELKIDSKLAFVILSSDDAGVRKVVDSETTLSRPSFMEEYDADAETLTLKATMGYMTGLDYSKEHQAIAFLGKRSDLGTYVGKNAFGVEKEISKSSEESWGIRVAVDVDFTAWIKFTLTNVASEQAKKWKGKLGGLCVCALERNDSGDLPFRIFSGVEMSEPKIDAPFDKFTSDTALLATDVEFWIYNVESGEVIAKFDARGQELKKSNGAAVPSTQNRRGATSSKPSATSGNANRSAQNESEKTGTGTGSESEPGAQAGDDETQVEYQPGITREDVLKKLNSRMGGER